LEPFKPRKQKAGSLPPDTYSWICPFSYVRLSWLRQEALCYVALLALALYMILQIRVRNALENESEPIILAGKKKSFTPTANKILELFASFKVLWLKDGRSMQRQLPQRYYELRRVLEMAGFGLDIFTSPP
jgi:hypothetical protein